MCKSRFLLVVGLLLPTTPYCSRVSSHHGTGPGLWNWKLGHPVLDRLRNQSYPFLFFFLSPYKTTSVVA